jgi:hypothetical protein
MHYLAGMYIHIIVRIGVYGCGYITSPLCKGLSWFIYEGSNTLSNIFVLVGTTASNYGPKCDSSTNGF